MPSAPNSRDEVIRRLSSEEVRIRVLGVRRLALFGSFVRDEARPESDVDVLVEFDPEKETFDNFIALCDLLEGVLARRVDLVTTNSLSPFIGPHILAQAIDVIRAA